MQVLAWRVLRVTMHLNPKALRRAHELGALDHVRVLCAPPPRTPCAHGPDHGVRSSLRRQLTVLFDWVARMPASAFGTSASTVYGDLASLPLCATFLEANATPAYLHIPGTTALTRSRVEPIWT